MPNRRNKTKKMLGFYASPYEVEAIKDLAESMGLTVSALLREIALGRLVVTPQKDERAP